MKKSDASFSPNQFYKNLRPEYFSDSKTTYKIELPREILANEIENISVNQKQDQFETLARKLCEIYVAPNLIPQVGPTGGGDGKTDTETYPVSSDISERWYVPENGWTKGENWAFAISSKKQWKPKLKSDIHSIQSTGRGYTKIFFITNQKISSRKKKEAQDEFGNHFKIDIIILDGEWLIEKIITNNHIDLVVDTLNMSDVYKSVEHIKGENDSYREKQIENLEQQIKRPNRYFEIDYQLIEDCLESAILSRELEHSREIIEGKFQRTLRYALKLKNLNQLGRIYYQQAWTAIFWFNDFESFTSNFINFKATILPDSNISVIRDYSTLYTVLRTHPEIENYVDISQESEAFYIALQYKIDNTPNLSSSLEAQTHLYLNKIIDAQKTQESCDIYIDSLYEIVRKIRGHLSYPFENTYKSIQVLGNIFANSEKYDKLIDELADLNEERNSELASSETYINRAIQKFDAGLYQGAIIYLGKSIVKLSKEESHDQLIFATRILADSYRNIGLLWASNSCLLFAATLSLSTWFSKGYISEKTYYITQQLAKNEILLGRLPAILSIAEFLGIISKQVSLPEDDVENSFQFIDMLLANKMMNAIENENFEILPDILNSIDLEFSADALLYILGYEKEILDTYDGKFDTEKLHKLFSNILSQPFKDQFQYPVVYFDKNTNAYHSKILGTSTELRFSRNRKLYIAAETILAFIESFFATSLEDIFPTTESLIIELREYQGDKVIICEKSQSSELYITYINIAKFNDKAFQTQIWEDMMHFLAILLSENFIAKNLTASLDNLFKKEEIYSRVSFVLNNHIFHKDFFGENSKIFFSDWLYKKHKTYADIREVPLELDNIAYDPPLSVKNDNHNSRSVNSVINVKLWDSAGWKGFGFFNIQNIDLGIVLVYSDQVAGSKIFDEWISKLTNYDVNNQIRIAIIKGINSDYPYWYRVHISKKIDITNKDGLFYSTSRFHELQAKDSTNLDKLTSLFEIHKKYTLYPAIMDSNNGFSPDFSRGITKTDLIIKEAWQVSINDIDRVAILKDDKIIIPEGITHPPVMEILNSK